MGFSAIVAGTGFEGRAEIIRQHCADGVTVILQREPDNPHDRNAIAVYLLCGTKNGREWKKIGHIKAERAEQLAKRMDEGEKIAGNVTSYYAPGGREHPRVSLWCEYNAITGDIPPPAAKPVATAYQGKIPPQHWRRLPKFLAWLIGGTLVGIAVTQISPDVGGFIGVISIIIGFLALILG